MFLNPTRIVNQITLWITGSTIVEPRINKLTNSNINVYMNIILLTIEKYKMLSSLIYKT